MTEGDRTAVGVELVEVDAEFVGRAEDLDGEGFVDLDMIDVADAHAGAGHRLLAGVDRAEAHDLGVEGRDAAGHDASDRVETHRLGLVGAHHQHGGGTIIERAGVAGGDGAVGTEHRGEGRDLLESGAGADAVILRHQGAVGKGVRGDFALEEPAGEGGLGTVLRRNAPLVLALTADAGVLHDVLGGLAHRDVDVGHAGGRLPTVGSAGRTLLGAGLGVGEDLVVRAGVGGAVHVAADGFDTTGDEAVALTGHDCVGGHADGLQRRRAVAVDGDARKVEALLGGDHAGDVVATLTAGLTDAPDDVFDLVGIHVDLAEHVAQGVGRHVVGTGVDQRTLVGPTDRGTGRGHDDGVCHGSSSGGSCEQTLTTDEGGVLALGSEKDSAAPTTWRIVCTHECDRRRQELAAPDQW